MLISFNCHNCDNPIEVDSASGQNSLQCTKCGTDLMVPTVKLARDTLDFQGTAKTLAAGERVGGFEIIRKLNTGGMGTVYLARQASMEREVALKVLSPVLARDSGNIERFQSEVRLQARLDHPNIVPAFEAGYADGVYYLAMTYVDGQSLEEIRRDGLLSEAEVVDIGLAVASALAYAWNEHHILHRDIKPSNIVIDRKGIVRLLDLGISKCVSDNSALTASSIICGTPQYMSPEQAKGDATDFRSDMYALGATLYHVATDELPFEGDSSVAILHQHICGELTPPREHRPELSEEFSELIVHMMAKDPADRPADWQTVALQLSAISPDAIAGSPPPPLPATVFRGAPQPAPVPIQPAESSTTETVKKGLGWAAKGLVLSCAAWGFFCLAAIVVFIWLVYAIFSGANCTTSQPSNPDVSAVRVSELRLGSGKKFSMDEDSMTLGPTAKGGYWLSAEARHSFRIEGALRFIAGEEVGFLLATDKADDAASEFAAGLPDLVKISFRKTDLGFDVVLYRGGFANPTELGRGSVKAEAGELVPFRIDKAGNGIHVNMKGQKVVSVDELFLSTKGPTGELEMPDTLNFWGVYVRENAAVEIDFSKAAVSMMPAKPAAGDGTGKNSDTTPAGG